MLMKNQLITDKRLIKFNRNFGQIIGIYTGALLFAVILLILVHEVGHYIAYVWKGYEDASIRITPFFGMTSTNQTIQPEDFVFIVLGGTVFNLTLAFLVAMLCRSSKSAYAIPLRMYAVMAFLVEGVVILAGLFFEPTITDFSWLISFGWSLVWVAVLGLVFILIGGYLNYEIWILLGFHQNASFISLLILNSPFLLYFLAGYLISQGLLPEGMEAVKSLMLICLIMHWVYLVIRILFAPVVFRFLLRKGTIFHPKITKQASTFSILLGCVSWVFSFMVLN